ncbi:MAG: nucleotide exchange factor GrpE [Burkholderiaceae bacterium]|nr:nucleotide exchange factor GrpE [Burkholderiaceae bacterium]
MTPDTPARTDGDLPTQQPSSDDGRPNPSTASPGRGAAEAADRPAGGDAGEMASGDPRAAELERRLAETHERYLRAVAETENVRRRAQEEVARAQKFGIEAFAESLLPVKDSLELALTAEAPDLENMKEGVGATLRLLASAFEKNRLVEIDPRGQKFDPNLHQAISTVPASGTQPPVAPGHVAHVLQKGYLIADRVLRPALVTVVQD